MEEKRPRITSFRDLDVYRAAYAACIKVMTELLPRLPVSEKYDLKDQLSRSVKAVPRLIAEGYAKKHQKAGFQKYIDDAMAECNETIVSLDQARDLYPQINRKACDELVEIYDKSVRQLYRLAVAWDSFKNSRQTKPLNDTSRETL